MYLDNLLKIVVIISLLGITLQDFKERNVYVWLFILSGFSLGFLHFNKVFYQPFILTTIINCSLVFTIAFVLFIYAKIILKRAFKSTFGLGDFLFFMVLAIGFPTATFLVLFSFSLIFSLLLYLILKNRLRHTSVPLAGLQALFMSFVLIINWMFNFSNLYTI